MSQCGISAMVAPVLHRSLILGMCAGVTLGTPSKRNILASFSHPHLLATALPQSYVFTTAIFLFVYILKPGLTEMV